MCGIVGYFISDQFSDDRWIKEMSNTLRHRGPDAEGYFYDTTIAMGHHRLSIIDLSENANQPMVSQNGRYVMVFNGEIYNYREIAKRYHFDHHKQSDSSVLLQLFELKGIDFTNELNGMFSIAIYDKESGELNLWRDRIGIKPLHYYYDGQNFAFASEIKALLQLPIKKEIDDESLKDYFYLEYIPEPRSIFKNIHKLEKGHHIQIKDAKLKKRCYYNLLERVQTNEKKSESEYLNEFEELITKSVKRRMVSDVEVGAFLSGGIDSSVICAAVGNGLKQPMKTFTIGFDEGGHNEGKYASEVARKLGMDNQIYHLKQKDALDLMTDTFVHFDEPFAVSSVLPMFKISQKASENVKVVLSGDGGDELFMGYGYYNWQKRMNTIRQLGGKTALDLTERVLKMSGGKFKRAARMFEEKDPERQWLHLWSQDQFMFTESEVSDLLNSPYRHQTILADWKKINQMNIDDFTKISLFDIRHYLANNLLQKVDITTMSCGLEARVPFLDHELIEFAINLPVEMKINKGTSKYILKRWLENHLPKHLIEREKWGFPAPVNVWLNQDFNALAERYLSKDAIQRSGKLNGEFIQDMLKRFRNGENYHFKRIWALICFQMWYERHFD